MNSARAIGLGAALLGLAWALPAAASPGWLQIGYNSGHSGFNNTETAIKPKNVATLANAGTYTTGGAVLTPVISKGIAYVRSTDQNLYAWNLATGKLVWSISLPTEDGPNGMAVASDRLVTNCVTGTNQSGICAFSTKTGKSLWVFGELNGQSFSPPTIAGKTVYVAVSYNEVEYADIIVAVDLETGAQLWGFGSCADYCEKFGPNAPAVDNGTVYFGCVGGGSGDPVTDTGVCAVNASTGALVWQYQLGCTCGGDGQGRLIAQGGTVYAAYQTANCYQCGYTIDVTALNESTGAKIYDTPLTGQLNDSYYPLGPPVLGPDGTVYEGLNANNNPNQPNQFALNANGTLQWQVSTVPSFGAPPTLVGKSGKGVLFFACSGAQNGGTTCALDASNGSVVWNSSDGGLASYDSFAPPVTGGAVYNDCNNNDLCVYKVQ